MQIFLGQSYRAEWKRDEPIHQSIGAECELERSAPDVHHHRPPDCQLEMRQCAAERQARFVVAVEDADIQPRLFARELEESLAISGIAYRAGGDDFGSVHFELLRQRRHSAKDHQGVLNRDFAQHPALVQTGTEPRRGLHFIDDPDNAGGRHVGDRLPDRVRPDVDGGHSHRAFGPLRRRSGTAAAQR